MSYTALIRTEQVTQLLHDVVRNLRVQSCPPVEIVFVDSSRHDDVALQLRQLGGRVIKYSAANFNFSEAINVGLEVVSTPWTLIISSHVLLTDCETIEAGFSALEKADAQAAYWYPRTDGAASVSTIDAASFNGYNALSNSCALVPTAVARGRPFRPEVFSAEDQEWGAWFMRERGARIVAISRPDFQYLNPKVNNLKTINEEVSIAYFTYRRNLWPDRVLIRLARALLAASRGRPERARLHWGVAKGLMGAWFSEPRRQSRYF